MNEDTVGSTRNFSRHFERVSPELDRILAPMNWQEMKTGAPAEAAFLAIVLTTHGGRIAQSPSRSASRRTEAAEALASLRKVVEWTQTLSDFEREIIAPPSASAPVDSAQETCILDFVLSSARLAAGIGALELHLSHEATGGGKKNLSSITIADALVRGWIIGHGELPEIYRDLEGRPGSPFSELAEVCFKHLGVRRDWYEPCRTARNEISTAQQEELRSILSSER